MAELGWARIPRGLLAPCWLAGARVLLGLVLVYIGVSLFAAVDKSPRLVSKEERVQSTEEMGGELKGRVRRVDGGDGRGAQRESVSSRPDLGMY
jgi:hypothetical protein